MLGDSPVFELTTLGGLSMVGVIRGGKFETLAAAPHRAISRHMAKKREPELNITELSKSDSIDASAFRDLLPRYEELTTAIRDLEQTNGKEEA